MQWLPFHSLSEADYKAIIRTFRSVFPHTTLWYTGASHTFLLATSQPLTEETLRDALARAAGDPFVRQDLGAPEEILGYLAFDQEALGAFLGPGPIVTDNDAFFLPSNAETPRILAALQAAVGQ
jgi:spermidine synthase